MSDSMRATIIAAERGFRCSECGGFVRGDAERCKHCNAEFEKAPPAPPKPDAPWFVQAGWALLSGAQAALRAALILLVLLGVTHRLASTWIAVLFAAVAAFVVVCLGMVLINAFHVSTGHALGIGALLAVLPHPLFWWLCRLYYGSEPFTYSTPGSPNLDVNVFVLSFISLIVVGWLTLPVSIFTTGYLRGRFTQRYA